MSNQTTQVTKKKSLPNGWAKYKKVQLEVTGHKNNKPQLSEVKKVKSGIVLSDEQALELNKHKSNTLIEYVKE